MVKSKTKAPAKAPAKLTMAEVFKTAKEYEAAAAQESTAKVAKTKAQKTLVREILERRKLQVMESDKFGGHTRITVVQSEVPQYDAEGLYAALNAAQRRLAFDRNINLNALDPAARKRVVEVLSKEELAAVTSYSLNLENLSVAVQARKISSKVVAKFVEFVKTAPYVRISHGSGK